MQKSDKLELPAYRELSLKEKLPWTVLSLLNINLLPTSVLDMTSVLTAR